MHNQVLQIAQLIVEAEAPDPFESQGGRQQTGFHPKLYVTEIDNSPSDQGKLSIHYVEDWGQTGDVSKILHVDLEDFCDPKYLLDIIG